MWQETLWFEQRKFGTVGKHYPSTHTLCLAQWKWKSCDITFFFGYKIAIPFLHSAGASQARRHPFSKDLYLMAYMPKKLWTVVNTVQHWDGKVMRLKLKSLSL